MVHQVKPQHGVDLIERYSLVWYIGEKGNKELRAEVNYDTKEIVFKVYSHGRLMEQTDELQVALEHYNAI